MADQAIYTHPNEPGAPQPGDVVVGLFHTTMCDEPMGPPGEISRLDPECSGALYWQLTNVGWAYRVRRPTPAELAAYHLGAP